VNKLEMRIKAKQIEDIRKLIIAKRSKSKKWIGKRIKTNSFEKL